MEATVRLPQGNTFTTQIGLGLATLMREPSRRGQERILEVAFDSGIRHFDVSPSYGFGAAENLLGRFLQGRRGHVTIATKVGIGYSSRGASLAKFQRPFRYVL